MGKKEELLETLTNYLSNNKDILISKEPKLIYTVEDKLIEKTAEHYGSLIFKLMNNCIVYNPHRFSEQQLKELALIVPDYSLVPAVAKEDFMFWSGLELI